MSLPAAMLRLKRVRWMFIPDTVQLSTRSVVGRMRPSVLRILMKLKGSLLASFLPETDTGIQPAVDPTAIDNETPPELENQSLMGMGLCPIGIIMFCMALQRT
jgi:hypothetical protein